jgi:hypothetical protein
MSDTTPRQTFRETVALVAAAAKAKLPEAVNGRVESAVKLVLGQDVEPQEDGTILVGSSSDPLKTYRLVGDTCECQDWLHGQAPGGWCQHRIAAGIHKRVQQLLPVVEPPIEAWPDNEWPDDEPLAPEPQPSAQPPPLPEAPASVNVRVTIGGRDVQWILRDTDEARLAMRLEALLARYPLPQPAPPVASPGQLTPQQHNALAMHQKVEGVCPLHNVQMKLNTKEGRSWWSHRTAEGWCKGK